MSTLPTRRLRLLALGGRRHAPQASVRNRMLGLSSEELSRIVDSLFASRSSSQPLAIDVPTDLGTALDLQLEVAARFSESGDPVGGWKVGMTSGSSWNKMGMGFRPHGYVLSSRILASGARLSLSRFLNCGVEPELAVILGSSLSGEVSDEEARARVRSVAPAFELIELRPVMGAAADPAVLVAEGLGNWGIVLGEEVPVEMLPCPLTCVLFRDGSEVRRETAGDTLVFDDPFVSLSRLSSQLGQRGVELQAGQPVITGSFAHLPVRTPSEWTARFIGIGDVTVGFDE